MAVVAAVAVVVVAVVSSIVLDRAKEEECREEEDQDPDHLTNDDVPLHTTDEDEDLPLTTDLDDETDQIHRGMDPPLLVATEDNHLILCLDTSYVGLDPNCTLKTAP